MSPLVKTKRQANFKDFKRFGAFKGLAEQKNLVFNSFVCQLGFFGTRGPLKHSFHLRFKLAHSCQKTPIYTRTCQINYYCMQLVSKVSSFYSADLRTRCAPAANFPSRKKSITLLTCCINNY
jgi:hypothetical protein